MSGASEAATHQAGWSDDALGALLRSVDQVFSAAGPLARATPGYVARPDQLRFAHQVARAIARRDTLAIEAGTGTGKTFAYLVPALLAECRVIISTAGKPLQDQLFHRDLPDLCVALRINPQAAVLKGRANYVCRYRLRKYTSESRPLEWQAVSDLRHIRIFAEADETGDISSCPEVPESSPSWRYATSNADGCLGGRCPYIGECFVFAARARARAADVLVVNHHLFLAAAAIDMDPEPRPSGPGGEGMGPQPDAGILPEAGLIIFDEAHKLPDIATAFFGDDLSTRKARETLRELRDILLSRFRRGHEVAELDKLVEEAGYPLMDLPLRLEEMGFEEGASRIISDEPDTRPLAPLLGQAAEAIGALLERVGPLIQEDAEAVRYQDLLLADARALKAWGQALAAPLDHALEEGDRPAVRWLERYRNDVTFRRTPLSVAEDMAALRRKQRDAGWVLTSATLATGRDDFSHFLREMGLPEATSFAYPSPFDYPRQGLLYVPSGLPPPDSSPRREYLSGLMERCWPLIDRLGGRAFVLCTSIEGMNIAAEELRRLIEGAGRPYEILLQREASRSQLLRRFRQSTQGAVLIGSMSFWEGVDIKGERLSLVIIDKLPFANQANPVIRAKIDWLERQGRNAFAEFSLPQAVIALKQGAGRLIRSEADRGLLIIGDRRICPEVRRYGAVFLNSLPPFSLTRDQAEALDFWARAPES